MAKQGWDTLGSFKLPMDWEGLLLLIFPSFCLSFPFLFFSACVYLCMDVVCACMCADRLASAFVRSHLEARKRHQVSSSTVSTLCFETRTLTDPGACHFCQTGWSMSLSVPFFLSSSSLCGLSAFITALRRITKVSPENHLDPWAQSQRLKDLSPGLTYQNQLPLLPCDATFGTKPLTMGHWHKVVGVGGGGVDIPTIFKY